MAFIITKIHFAELMEFEKNLLAKDKKMKNISNCNGKLFKQMCN